MITDEAIDKQFRIICEWSDQGHFTTFDIEDDEMVRRLIALDLVQPIGDLLRPTKLGFMVYESGGYLKYKASEKEKSDLAFRKLKLDVSLGEKVVADYPTTKKLARIAIGIAGLTLALSLLKWICTGQN